jgi:hypothetical protein
MMRVGYESHGGVEYTLGVEDPPVQAVSLNQPAPSVGNDRRKRTAIPAGHSYPAHSSGICGYNVLRQPGGR